MKFRILWLLAVVYLTPFAALASTKMYLVIDLSRGPNASTYPVSYLDEMPAEGWSDEYKTTKLVLRRIEAGSFIMGGNCKTCMPCGRVCLKRV